MEDNTSVQTQTQTHEESGVDAAIRELAAAKIEYATEFLRYKTLGKGLATDGQAHQQATLSTGARVAKAEALLEVELIRERRRNEKSNATVWWYEPSR